MGDFGAGDQFKATKRSRSRCSISPTRAIPSRRTGCSGRSSPGGRRDARCDGGPLSDYDQKRSLLIGPAGPVIIPRRIPARRPLRRLGRRPPGQRLHRPHADFKAKVREVEPPGRPRHAPAGGRQVLPAAGAAPGRLVDYSLAVRTDVLSKLTSRPGHLGRAATVLSDEGRLPANFPFSDRWGVPTPGAACSTRSRRDTGPPAAGATSTRRGTAGEKKYVFTGARTVQADAPVPARAGDRQAARYGELHAVRRQEIQKFGSGRSLVISTNAQTLINDYRKPWPRRTRTRRS